MFNAQGYLAEYRELLKDVEELTPWEHYVEIGKSEGLDNGNNPPIMVFDCNIYELWLKTFNVKVFNNLWEHYLSYGRYLLADGLVNVLPMVYLSIKNSHYFNESFYKKKYLDKKESEDPIIHYITIGCTKGNNPSLSFDTNYYLSKYQDVKKSGINPLYHYINYGILEGRSPYNDHSYFNKLDNSICTELSVPMRESREENVTIIKSIEDIDSNSILIILPMHLGDIIASEPIVRYLRQECPSKKLYWVVKENYIDVLLYNPYLDGIIQIDSIREIMEILSELKDEQKIINLMFSNRYIEKEGIVWYNSLLGKSFSNYFYNDCLLSSFSYSAGIPRLFVKPIFWQSRKKLIDNELLPKNYLVMHLKSNDTANRSLTSEQSELLVDILIKSQIHVIEIGLEKSVDIVSEYYHDFTHYRDLQGIYQIIKSSKLFLGVDSSFAHMANCCNKDGVIMLGKLVHYDKYNPYSGNYWNGENVIFEYAPEGESVNKIDVNKVAQTVISFYRIL